MRLLEKLGQPASQPTSRPSAPATSATTQGDGAGAAVRALSKAYARDVPALKSQLAAATRDKDYNFQQMGELQKKLQAAIKARSDDANMAWAREGGLRDNATDNAANLRKKLTDAEDRVFSTGRDNTRLQATQRFLEGQLGDVTSRMKALQKDKDYNFQQMEKFRLSDAARKQNAINMQISKERRRGKTRTLGAGAEPTRGSNVEDAVIKKLEAAKNAVKAAPGNAARGVKNTVSKTLGGVDAGVRSVGSALKNLAPQELRQMGAAVGSSRDDVNDRIIGGTAIGGASAVGGGLGVRKILQARAAREAASRVPPTLLQKLRFR